MEERQRMDRKKELREQYKSIKFPMGIFIIRCKLNNKCRIEISHNLTSGMNKEAFQLKWESHKIEELQKEWKKYGEENFIIEILEELEYDKDENKIDYSEELSILKMIWEEKLLKEGLEFYIK